MIKTNHYETLPSEVKEILADNINFTYLSTNGAFIRLKTKENRSVIFEIKGYDIIIKWLLPKGQRDADIDALLDLDGIGYFPKLYAYQQMTYLIMEKAMGESVDLLIEEDRISDEELRYIREEYTNSVIKSKERKRFDWDFKLEHLLWDKKKNELKIVDLGLYDPYLLSDNSFVEELESSVRFFNECLHDLGRYIDK